MTEMALNGLRALVTDNAVIGVKDQGLVLKEVAPGWSPEEI